jgi:glycosyltransferase involved in cell wall biosynthesis
MIKSILIIIIFYPIFLIVKVFSLLLPLVKHKGSASEKKILYLATFFPNNSGYEYRVLRWANILRKQGYEVTMKTVFEKDEFDRYRKKTDLFFYIKPLIKRTFHVLRSSQYSHVIVRREILLFNDYGNLFLEKLLLAIHPRAILDFDDDIGASKKEPRQISSRFGKILMENGNKFNTSLGMYQYFIVGSKYLEQKVLQLNPDLPIDHIVIIPTCVDYDKYKPVSYDSTDEVVRFGWIGGNHNLPLLEEIFPVLNQVAAFHPLELVVISGKETTYEDTEHFKIINIPWDISTEIQSLQQIHIGLMPLKNNLISKGKCGFKLIQYMGLGIVSIASAVTVNNEIIEHGENGFLVYDENEWRETILAVVEKRDKWAEIGRKAREKITKYYSFKSNSKRYVDFIRRIEHDN